MNKTQGFFITSQLHRRFFMRHITLLSIIIMASAGTLPAQTDSFPVGGTMRSFIVHAPTGLTNPPLVISMHGLGGTGSQQQSMTGFNKIADREKFIVVYPNGITKLNGSNGWDVSGSTDVNFILAIIDTMYARYAIDRNRAYATGFSMGGMMSYKLACAAADKFAAIGPASGYLMGGMGGTGCSPARPVPILHTHGSLDSVVPFSGLANYIKGWVTKDGCPTTVQITKPYPASNENSRVTKEYYGPCSQGSEIIVLTVEGMGHAYPGSFGSTDINASEEFWAFFKTHALGAAGIAQKNSFLQNARPFSALYHAGKIHLLGDWAVRGVRLYDIQGKTIFAWKTGGVPMSTIAIPAGRSARGMYLLDIDGIKGRAALHVMVP
jgi:poly(3-hydroxybutyrate) depolymerase